MNACIHYTTTNIVVNDYRGCFGCYNIILWMKSQWVSGSSDSLPWTFILLFSLASSLTLGCERDSTLVQLCSIPQNVTLVCPGETLIFTCRTVGSPLLGWSSSQYISESGVQLFFTSNDVVNASKPSPNRLSTGNLTKLNVSDPAMIIIESQLQLVVSDEYNSSQIMCSNTANGIDVAINFNVGKKLLSCIWEGFHDGIEILIISTRNYDNSWIDATISSSSLRPCHIDFCLFCRYLMGRNVGLVHR